MNRRLALFSLISTMHPSVLLLLKRVCVIENMAVDTLVEAIMAQHKTETTADTAISVFCANYFAQSSTLQGHEAARHGAGPRSIQIVADSMRINARRYDLSLNVLNDCRISEDMGVYETRESMGERA